MDRTVREACACAEKRGTGVDAAIQCATPIQRYGAQVVQYRDGWSKAQHEVEATLRRLLEHCLTKTKSYVQSLDELGLLANGVGDDIPRPAVVASWYKTSIDTLAQQRGQLARVENAAGESRKGMIQSVENGELVLRMAPTDGGGERRVPLQGIRSVRVLHFPGS